jgi:small subunit ribosomal protein S20
MRNVQLLTISHMANTKSAAKRARQGGARRTRNASVTNALKSEQKKLRVALAGGKLDEARSEYSNASAALDKAAKRGIIHKNSANRRKSSLNRALRSAQGTGSA